MLNSKNIYKINLILSIFYSAITCSDQSRTTEFLSDVVSEYYSNISNLIQQEVKKKPMGLELKNHRENVNLRIQNLTARQERILNAWGAEDLDHIIVYLPDHLKIRAQKAKVDFDTPVLDTRSPLRLP